MIKNSCFCFICTVFLFACSRPILQNIGEQYLGAKYERNPLGEEKLPDDDPIIRFDAFDCVTFVETVLANGDEEELRKIRYKNGEIGFLTRNHFIESDWLENNKDIVENVSDKYAYNLKTRTAIIDKQNWFKRVYDLDTNFSKRTVKIEYIPYDAIKSITTTKPLIVLFIIDNPKIIDKIGSDLAIAHIGFLLPDGTFRHASSRYGRVMDVNFYEYIQEIAKHKTNLGIALLEIK